MGTLYAQGLTMDRDKDWTAGYVTELEYTYGYYRELSCISAAAAMEQQGVSPACSRPSAILTRSECRAAERLVNNQTALTADTALHLAKAFSTTPAFWMSLQAQHDIERAEDAIGARLKTITPIVGDA